MEALGAAHGLPEQNRDSVRQPTFHCFPRLPYELRVKVWHHLAPELSTQPLLLHLSLDIRRRRVTPTGSLKSHTQPSRALLATHRESRALAAQALPDSLPIRYRGPGGAERQGALRMWLERDIVLLELLMCDGWTHRGCGGSLGVSGFSERVVNLGLNFAGVEGRFRQRRPACCFLDLGGAFPNVRVLWACGDYDADDFFGFSVPVGGEDAGDGWDEGDGGGEGGEGDEVGVGNGSSCSRSWCDEPSTRKVLLEGVGPFFNDTLPDKADAEVFIPDVKNPLIHQEVNSRSYYYRAVRDKGRRERHEAWDRFFLKGSAFEWFSERFERLDVDDYYSDWDEDPNDNVGGEEIWGAIVRGGSKGWAKGVEMWPLVARHRIRPGGG